MKEPYQSKLVSRTAENIEYNINRVFFVGDLESKLYRMYLKTNFSKIIVVCVGTSEFVGDSFGPIVGEKLQKLYKDKLKIEIYGTVSQPVHFLNAVQYIELAKRENGCVVIVDSAFASLKELGNTYVNWGGIYLGRAFQKEFYFPANINVKTVIANNTNNIKENFECITKYEKATIQKLSDIVAQGMSSAISNFVMEL